MSIANELSSDVANAVLSRNDEETSMDSSELKNVVMKVHWTLRHLTTEASKRSRRLRSSSESQAKRAASNQ
jgi:hypothetical protein